MFTACDSFQASSRFATLFTKPLLDYQENALRIESLTPAWTTSTSEFFAVTVQDYRALHVDLTLADRPRRTLILGSLAVSIDYFCSVKAAKKRVFFFFFFVLTWVKQLPVTFLDVHTHARTTY